MTNNRLPTFLIVGAARSGTTALFHALAEHPQVHMGTKKEPHFFSQNWSKGLGWYEQNFTPGAAENTIGEASVSYSYPQFPETPARIAEVIPNARLIYMLRDPVERAYSHWLYYTHYRATETRPFETAVREDPIYLGASSYATWLRRYFVHFEQEQLLPVVFEEYVRNPAPIFERVLRHIGVDPGFRPQSLGTKTNARFRTRSVLLQRGYKRLSASPVRRVLESATPPALRPHVRNAIHQVLGTQSGVPSMTSSARALLQSELADEVHRTEEILGRTLTCWKWPARR